MLGGTALIDGVRSTALPALSNIMGMYLGREKAYGPVIHLGGRPAPEIAIGAASGELAGVFIMQSAPIPADDAARVADLQALEILDTPREERFDRITDLAADVFGMKMCFVTLVDSNRQWFKSTCGLEGVDETPREPGFCAHTIFASEAMVVPDATKDPRFADNPFVTGEFGLRFYAGTALRGPAGKAVGALCLVDTEPHDFGPRQIAQLKKFANLVQAELLRSH